MSAPDHDDQGSRARLGALLERLELAPAQKADLVVAIDDAFRSSKPIGLGDRRWFSLQAAEHIAAGGEPHPDREPAQSAAARPNQIPGAPKRPRTMLEKASEPPGENGISSTLAKSSSSPIKA